MNKAAAFSAGHAKQPLRCCGFTLTELMVAMTLGLGLLAGAMHLFGIALNAWRTVEAVATLEERLSFALQAIATDVQLAGYRGESHLSGPVTPATAHCRGRDVSTWALAINRPVEALKNATALPCPAYGRTQINSDALVIRHHDPMSDTLISQMHGWYIDRESSLADQPSLRRHTLLPDGTVANQEIIPGIENLKVMLGIDTDGDRLVDNYVAPGTASGTVLMLRIELRARAGLRENSLPGDGYRRITARRTFFLRNV